MKGNCLKNSWIFPQDLKQLQKLYQPNKKIKTKKEFKLKVKIKNLSTIHG